MSTVKNYDAENFTSSEIEIKSGQNYDIKFKNAISGQVDWNVKGNDIVVTVLEPQLNKDYKTFEYFKKDYTAPKTFATQVLEKTVVTPNDNFVTKHSYLLVTENATAGYDLKVMEQTRAKDANGVWANDLSDAVQKEGTQTIHVTNLDELQAVETYGAFFTNVNAIADVLGEDNVIAYGNDEKTSVYTTAVYETHVKGATDWEFGAAKSSVTKSQPEAPATLVTESTTFQTVKYTQAWNATNSNWDERVAVEGGVASVEGTAALNALVLERYCTYNTTEAKYDFVNNAYGEAVNVDDSTLTVGPEVLPQTSVTKYYKKTYNYLGKEDVPQAGYEESTTPFSDAELTIDDTASYDTTSSDYEAKYNDFNSTKVLGTLTLKNATTFGQDDVEIGLVVRDKNGNVIIGYEYGDEVEPHNLKTNDYTITGVPDDVTTPTKYTFTGTSLNENAESTAIADTFNLGTGSNTININLKDNNNNFVKFGNDTVIGTEGEHLTVNFTGFDSSSYKSEVSYSDKDVILTIKGKESTTEDLGSITFQGLNEKNVFGYYEPSVEGLGTDFTLFNDGQITGEVDTTDATKATFTGTWRADNAVSGATNDTFDLKTGYDSITFNAVNSGNDTVVANEGEYLDLTFDKSAILQDISELDVVQLDIKGNDVVATTATAEYYALAKVDRDYVVDGHVREANSDMTHISILDKLTDVKYDLITGANETTAITKEAYDALSETAQAAYQFKEGTLKFTLQSGKGHGATSNARTAFTTEAVLYKMSDYKNANWSDLGVYADQTKYDDTHILLNQHELYQAVTGTYNFDVTGISGLKIYESLNGAEAVDVTNEYLAKVGTIVTGNLADDTSLGAENNAKYTEYNKALLAAASEGSVTIKNALTSAESVVVDGKSVTASAYAIDTMNEDIKEQMKAANTLFEAEDVVAKSKKGKLDLSKVSNDKVISLTGLTSENGKGANIITKAGNDTIVGSSFNDTLNLKAGNNDITESAGVNKITTGKGDDEITIKDYASATIKTSGGNNIIELNSIGINKFTGGNGVDKVYINADVAPAAPLSGGYNTVKAGKKGTLVVEAANGNNNITGGKKADDIRLFDGVNKVNAGAGDDYIIADDGYNTITLGKGNDDIVINGGTNVVKGTAGNNTYTINSGINVITGGKNVDEFIFTDNSNSFVNGGKGNDIYDLKDYGYDGALSIKDTSGKNVLKLADKDTVIFDVTLGKKAKKDKIGNVFTFDNDGDLDSTEDSVTFKGKISTVNVDGVDYTLNVKGVAEQVASFMRSAGYGTGDSAYDLLAAGGEDAAKLFAIYQGN